MLRQTFYGIQNNPEDFHPCILHIIEYGYIISHSADPNKVPILWHFVLTDLQKREHI